MAYIDDFIKNEENKMTRVEKLFSNYPIVTPTISISYPLPPGQLGEKKVIKPSVWNKVIAIPFFLFAGMFWVILLKMLLEFRFPFLVILSGFLFVTFLIYLLLYNTFFNKKYIYTITVDAEGISIDSDRFYWTDIAETGIMTRQGGRKTDSCLLIFNKDTTVKKCDLFKFGISNEKLAAIIEYYKAKAIA